MRFSEQGLDQSASQLNALLLTLSVFVVVLPGAYHMAMSAILNSRNHNTSSNSSDKEGTKMLQISHPVSDFAVVYCWIVRLMRRWQIAIIMLLSEFFVSTDDTR